MGKKITWHKFNSDREILGSFVQAAVGYVYTYPVEFLVCPITEQLSTFAVEGEQMSSKTWGFAVNYVGWNEFGSL